MKTGNIIFLTRRAIKNIFDYRGIISYLIAVFTRFKGQKIKDVKVHSAIVYEYLDEYYVRDMDKNGDRHYTFKKYEEKFGDRMEIVERPRFTNITKEKIQRFNTTCRNFKVKYDYKNTFFFQVIKRLFGFFIKDNSYYSRMCAEDVQRQLNIFDYMFSKPEEVNPNILYLLITTINAEKDTPFTIIRN